MDRIEAGRYWDENAPVWTRLARAGCDIYRDYVNTPAFLAMLPDVSGLTGLDIGCGEGHNTRLLAGRGARMAGIDISPTFIAAARQAGADDPRGVEFRVADACELPFEDRSFDFATAFMSLMDMPDARPALREARRVLTPDGFCQFSISHPCTNTPHRRLIRDEDGRERALEIGGYFDPPSGRVDEWIFTGAPPELREGLRRFRVPCLHRTLSWWLNAVVDAGLVIERVNEPRADDRAARECPKVADTRLVPYFLHVRCRRAE